MGCIIIFLLVPICNRQFRSFQDLVNLPEEFFYDKHGNITTLTRGGRDFRIDDLRMTYNGNQVTKIDDWESSQNLNNVREYHDLNSTGDDFAYDANGNMIKDLDRDIVTVQYNLLNLPTLIQFKKGGQILNTYAADGRKLRTMYANNIGIALNPGQTRDDMPGWYSGQDYIGNIEYGAMFYNMGAGELGHERGINFVFNPEGYAGIAQYSTAPPFYYYYRRDHLGNNREVWRAPRMEWVQVTSFHYDWHILNPAVTLSRTELYPSGLPWPNTVRGSRMYQEKEWIEMHGLDMYDFHFRLYDPLTGRTPHLDPHAENYPNLSPYSWVGNRFPNAIDPDGRDVWVIYEDENQKRQQLQYRDGQLYDTRGNLYEGNNQDALAILGALNFVKGVDEFTAKVIGTLESSDKRHYIESGSRAQSIPYPKTLDSFVAMDRGVEMGSQNIVTLNNKTIERGLEATKETTLAHEIRHAYDKDQGLYKGEKPGTGVGADRPSEHRAVGFENRVRNAMGLQQRTTYGGRPITPYPYAR